MKGAYPTPNEWFLSTTHSLYRCKRKGSSFVECCFDHQEAKETWETRKKHELTFPTWICVDEPKHSTTRRGELHRIRIGRSSPFQSLSEWLISKIFILVRWEYQKPKLTKWIFNLKPYSPNLPYKTLSHINRISKASAFLSYWVTDYWESSYQSHYFMIHFVQNPKTHHEVVRLIWALSISSHPISKQAR